MTSRRYSNISPPPLYKVVTEYFVQHGLFTSLCF